MSAFYRGATKAVIGAFGALFSDMHVIRRKNDTVTGEAVQDIKVPISYSSKTKWWQMLLADPSRAKQMNIDLPRMSFEITGYTYDANRKQTRSSSVACVTNDGATLSVDTPVPWNLDFSLYIVANNTEDCLQIIEQIIPMFNPDYTIVLRNVKEMGINTNVPVSLNSINIQDDYEGEMTTHRLVVYTLTFVVKMLYYGEVRYTDERPEVDINVNGGDVNTTVSSGVDSEGNIRDLIEEGELTLNAEIVAAKTYWHKSPEVRCIEPQTGANQVWH